MGVVDSEAQLLLAPCLMMVGWMFKERVRSTHDATDSMWSKWVTLITEQNQTGNPKSPKALEVTMD